MGEPLSDEHRKAISEGLQGNTHSEETKQKMAEAERGNEHDEETKQKISESVKQYWDEDGHEIWPDSQSTQEGYPAEFHQKKAQVKKRDGYECRQCGLDENLDVHHRDMNPENNKLDNLVTLCRSCHFKVHQN
jgi:hypothetical protein